MAEIEEAQQIQIKVMMAADGAQAVNGKLFILGGGFDHVAMASKPLQHRFDLAIIVDVPWTWANEPFQLVVEQFNADGEPCGYRAEAQMETGRPPGSRRGTSFSVPIALPVVAEFSEPGRYVFQGSINGEERARVAIEAVAVGAPTTAPGA